MEEQGVQRVNGIEVEDMTSGWPNRMNSPPVVQRKAMPKEEMDANGMEAFTTSSIGSNYDELADDASSSNPIRCKAQCVGYIFKLPEEIPLEQQLRDQVKRLMVEPIGTYESTAESARLIRNKRKYTPEMIDDKLHPLKLDPWTLSEVKMIYEIHRNCLLCEVEFDEMMRKVGPPPGYGPIPMHQKQCDRHSTAIMVGNFEDFRIFPRNEGVASKSKKKPAIKSIGLESPAYKTHSTDCHATHNMPNKPMKML